MDYSSSLSPSSAPVVFASNSNGSSGDSKSVREAAASSPSAAQTVSSAIGTTEEDDLALSVALSLSKEAWLRFRSGNYPECVNALRQLLQKNENDPKVLHNVIIAESFQNGCSDPKKILDKLNDLKKRREELVLSSKEQAQSDVGNTGNTISGGNKGINIAMQHSSGTSSSPAVSIDEFDTTITMFNMAVVWFHLHEYPKPFSILDRLFQNIEPINEATALRICLLMLDVGLLSNHFSRCADVINYVERVFCINNSPNQVDNGNLAQQQHPNLASKSILTPIDNSMISDSLNPDTSADTHLLESSLGRSLSEEGLDDETLQLLSSLEITRKNLLRICVDLSTTQPEDSISTIDLRPKLHLYKVRFLIATRNLKAAKREVKMAMNMAHGKDYTLALYLKSQLEYARTNHQKAIKLLVASINRAETGMSTLFLNNLGCIYHKIGKFHTSTVLFSKALSSSSFLRKKKPPRLSTISQDKSLQIIYNCGVNYLACGKPLPAARCFQKASLVFYNRPLLWLKIAECCLLALEKGLIKAGASDVVVHVIGKGKWRHLALEDGGSRNVRFDLANNTNDKQPDLSITYARQCLLNALHLLEVSDSKRLKSGLVHEVGSGHASGNGEAKSGLNMSFMNSMSEYEDFVIKRNQMIKQAVLADLAYVELELENPLSALSTAKSLLKHPECSRVHIFLGNMYAAEALCKLNRLKEASEHLYTYVVSGDDNSVKVPYNEDDIDKLGVKKRMDSDEANGDESNSLTEDESAGGLLLLNPVDARGTLYANLAVVYAMQGDVEQAQEVVKQALSIIPNYSEVIVTAIYLDVLQGKTHDAISKLKQCNRIRFVNGSCS